MAEQIVKLESTTPRGVYLHSIAAVPGMVAEQTFITLMNPVGSGRVMTLGTIALSYSNTSPATVVDPVRGWRISAHSGGSLVAASGIGKFSTTMPNATAEVRVDNPTITKVYPVFNSPPPIDNRSSNVHTVEIPPGATFLMRPGEGIAINKLSGTTSATWNITIVWAEAF